MVENDEEKYSFFGQLHPSNRFSIFKFSKLQYASAGNFAIIFC